MASRFVCVLLRHLPKKSRARFDGDVFRAPCRHCGRDMIRLDDGWRLDVAEPGLRRARRRLAALAAAMLLAIGLGFLIAPRATPPGPHQFEAAGTAIPIGANKL